MPVRDRLSDFLKSGPQRLKDAEELMEKPTADAERSDADTRHLRGAMYLAGYAVECLLKAYLIEQERCQSLTQARTRMGARRKRRGQEPIERIASTSAGHDIYYLVGLTDISARPGYDAKLWGRLAAWKSTWRYEHDAPSRPVAERFLDDVRFAVAWLRPKIEAR